MTYTMSNVGMKGGIFIYKSFISFLDLPESKKDPAQNKTLSKEKNSEVINEKTFRNFYDC